MARFPKQSIMLFRIGLLSLCIVLSVFTAAAQVPQTINFQGYLTDAAGTPINGNRSMTFKLYTVASGGAAAWTETQPTVAVTNGVYNVRLGSVTPIALSTPVQYYLGVAVGTDPEMTPRTALTSVMSALTLRDVAIKGDNTFVGQIAGNADITGGYNTFVGQGAGYATTTGYDNTFLGWSAGRYNTTGNNNTFVGEWAGRRNSTGIQNTFLGASTGYANISGVENTFLGADAGNDNRTGSWNTFVGSLAGNANTTGAENTFLGQAAGTSNTHGSYNTFLGRAAGRDSISGSGNVFIGHQAGLSETGSNKLYIDNSSTSSPLIYGEFDNNRVRVNGQFEAGSAKFEVGGGSIAMTTPGGWPGMIAYSPNGHRRDIQFYDDSMSITVSSSSAPSSSNNGIQILENGTTVVKVLQITGGSDLAEPFEVTGTAIEPGMVVSIDSQRPGQLRIADMSYDRTVAGVISGAGGVKPGMLMGQQGSIANGANPVALTGRVYVWADATYGSIAPGDLLTTSATPGHAMKVTDSTLAQGAVLGKAMTKLEQGQGLVLVLVTLQ